MPHTRKRKRKNKSSNVSGERTQKVRVSNSQLSMVPSLHGMETQMINGNSNNSICQNSSSSQNAQHSTPVTPVNNCKGNLFILYGPQGPQSQFAGYISPIPNQQHNQPQQHPQPQHTDIMEALRVMSRNIEQVSTKLNKLDLIEHRLSELEKNVGNVNTELKDMKAKVNRVEESVIFINKQYEDQTKEVLAVKKSLSEMSNVNENILKELSLVKSEFENLNERHLDLQTRSMRDNLIFEGIIETQEENTEEVLRDFLKSEMNITEEPQFQRVHRMGEKVQGRHRPIIAKFVLFKEREKVRKAAPSKLAGKPFGINEQFPKEINDRRKLLYPHYKHAKRLEKKAVMIADKLFVNGTQIPLSSIHNPASTQWTDPESTYGPRQPATRSANRPENRFAATRR